MSIGSALPLASAAGAANKQALSANLPGDNQPVPALLLPRNCDGTPRLHLQVWTLLGAGWPRSDARRASAQAFRGNNFEEIDVTHLLSAGTTFKDVPIPFPHVTVTVLAATIRIRGLALPVSDRNPVIFDADENSLCLPIFLVQARGGCGGTEPDGQCRAWETPSVSAAGSLGCCGTAKRGGKRHSMEENDGRMGSR
jgi:hypothetical protein